MRNIDAVEEEEEEEKGRTRSARGKIKRNQGLKRIVSIHRK